MISRTLQSLNSLDRRWIFLAMASAVAIPILLQIGSDERPTTPVIRLFEKVEELPPGSRVLLPIDFDPWDPLESTCRHASLSIL